MVHPVEKRKGRRTNGIRLMTERGQDVTFTLQRQFPNMKVRWRGEHLGVQAGYTISYGGVKYLYVDQSTRGYWHSVTGVEHLRKVVPILQAVAFLANTDSSKSWEERLVEANKAVMKTVQNQCAGRTHGSLSSNPPYVMHAALILRRALTNLQGAKPDCLEEFSLVWSLSMVGNRVTTHVSGDGGNDNGENDDQGDG